MNTKMSTWLMATGFFFAFVGLCFIPAAFGPDGDGSTLGPGATLFGFGMLVVASGVYAKARALGSNAQSDSSATVKRTRKAACDRCGMEEPVIQCRVHQLHLCGDCLAAHYDFRSCAYVPSTRRVTAKSAAAARAQTASS